MSTLRVRCRSHARLELNGSDTMNGVGGLAEHLARVSIVAALAERLAVVRADRDDRVVQVSVGGEVVEQHADHAVGVSDRVVVDVDVAGAEQRGIHVVDVLVDVHQVQVHEPAPSAVDAQELERRLDRAFVGARLGRGRVLFLVAAAGVRPDCGCWYTENP